MQMRNWFETHNLKTGLILVIIFSLTVGNIYVNLINQFLFDLELPIITTALLSVSIRFIISALVLFLLIPITFYEKPRNVEMYVRELKFNRGYSLKVTIPIGIVSCIVFTIVSVSILRLLGIFPNDIFSFLREPSENRIGWLWLLFAINPAIFEEMAFRGVLFSNFEKKYDERKVILMTAVLFGLFHFTGLANGQDIVGVTLMGTMAGAFAISWGYMNVKTKSIIPSMIMHYFINATSEVLLVSNTEDIFILLQIIGQIIFYPVLSILVIKIIMKEYTKNEGRSRGN